MSSKRPGLILPLLIVLALLLAACGSQTATGSNGKVTIKLFFHSGQGSERDALSASRQESSVRSGGSAVAARTRVPSSEYNAAKTSPRRASIHAAIAVPRCRSRHACASSAGTGAAGL